MKRSFITFILAALFAAAPVLSAAQAGSVLTYGEKTAAIASEITSDECADCEECDEQSGVRDCAEICQSVCSTAGNLAISSQGTTGILSLATISFDAGPDDRMSGVLAVHDIPPPRI